MNLITKETAESLFQFAQTSTEKSFLEYIISKNGTYPTEAGRGIGISERQSRRIGKGLLERASASGVDVNRGMMGEGVSPGFELCAQTTFIKDGVQIHRWDKTRLKKSQELQNILDAINDACDGLPVFPKIKKPKKSKTNLLNLYTFSDVHLGMFADALESGEAYNTEIAQNLVMEMFHQMMSGMPDAETCVICNLGDFLHFDSLVAETRKSKNPLDADQRFFAIAKVALDLQIWLVKEALNKHEKVHLINVEGNHDEVGSIWLKIAMQKIFNDNKRVVIDVDCTPYQSLLFGRTFLCWHHGHQRTEKDLAGFFSADERFRASWGVAKHTYIHTGHRHSERVIDLPGCKIERHPTLAVRSSYESRSGYTSTRKAVAICYDDAGNEKIRLTVSP